MNSKHIKRILIWNYYEKLHANGFNNSNKMDKFPERHKLPKFIQEEADKLESPIAIKEKKNNKTKPETLSPDGSTSDFYQTF